jgi:hypothetical protein
MVVRLKVSTACIVMLCFYCGEHMSGRRKLCCVRAGHYKEGQATGKKRWGAAVQPGMWCCCCCCCRPGSRLAAQQLQQEGEQARSWLRVMHTSRCWGCGVDMWGVVLQDSTVQDEDDEAVQQQGAVLQVVGAAQAACVCFSLSSRTPG